MPKQYSEERELTDFVNKLMARKELVEFNPLREQQIKVLSCFVISTTATGEEKPGKGKGEVVLKKISDAERIFIKEQAQFILLVDHASWSEWNEKKQAAHVYSALAGIVVETGAKGVKIKCVKPDLQAHSAAIARFGLFTNSLQGFKEALDNKSQRLLDDCFEFLATGGRGRPAVAETPEPAEPAEVPEEEAHIKTSDEVMADADADEAPVPRKPILPKRQPAKKQ